MLSDFEQKQETQKGIVATVAGLGENILQIAFNGASICIKLVGDAAIYIVCTNPIIAVASCTAICNLAGIPLMGIMQINQAALAMEASVEAALKVHKVASTAAAIGIAAATITPEIKSTCESILSIIKSCVSLGKHIISHDDHAQLPVDEKFSERELTDSMVLLDPLPSTALALENNSIVLVDGEDMFRSVVLEPIGDSNPSLIPSSASHADETLELLERLGASVSDESPLDDGELQITSSSSIQVGDSVVIQEYF